MPRKRLSHQVSAHHRRQAGQRRGYRIPLPDRALQRRNGWLLPTAVIRPATAAFDKSAPSSTPHQRKLPISHAVSAMWPLGATTGYPPERRSQPSPVTSLQSTCRLYHRAGQRMLAAALHCGRRRRFAGCRQNVCRRQLWLPDGQAPVCQRRWYPPCAPTQRLHRPGQNALLGGDRCPAMMAAGCEASICTARRSPALRPRESPPSKLRAPATSRSVNAQARQHHEARIPQPLDRPDAGWRGFRLRVLDEVG